MARPFCFRRALILLPALNDAWDIIEVKSTTSLKDVHLADLTFQTWVLAMAGLRIRACSPCHINPDFIRRGQVDPKKFFVLEDVTDRAANLGQIVEDKLDEMFKTIRQRQHPDIKIGPHCDDPYTCALHDLCWKFLPQHNVLDLYRGTKKGFDLLIHKLSLYMLGNQPRLGRREAKNLARCVMEKFGLHPKPDECQAELPGRRLVVTVALPH